MANDEHVALLKKGVDAWNKWRVEIALDPCWFHLGTSIDRTEHAESEKERHLHAT